MEQNSKEHSEGSESRRPRNTPNDSYQQCSFKKEMSKSHRAMIMLFCIGPGQTAHTVYLLKSTLYYFQEKHVYGGAQCVPNWEILNKVAGQE